MSLLPNMAPLPLNPSVKAILDAKLARDAMELIDAAKRDAQTVLRESQIYVGLNDADTKTQKRDTASYVEVLKRVCVDYGVAFSFDIVSGGYIHDDGEYTEENTIVLTLIDTPSETVDEIARDLCGLFHQESVLVTVAPVKVRSIRVTDETDEAGER